MEKTKLRVAAVQAIGTDDPAQNARHMERFFKQAKKKRVEVICFPEGYLSFYDLTKLQNPEPQYANAIRDAVRKARDLASQYGMWTVVGTLIPGSAKWRNVAYLLTPDGRIRGTYDKIHTLEGRERDALEEGQKLPTFRIDGVRVGLQICNDQKYFEGWAALAQKGCDVVFHPMWGNGDRGLNLYENGAQMCRAWENGMFVVTANAISPDPKKTQFALSQIIGPDGRPLARAKPDVETLLVADLDIEQARQLRKRQLNARRTSLFNLKSQL
ncbi:MAG: carbon-nitrogen hydrolase family protein [Candidatus Latescibacteria bacterium]|nr:carbon-nitrogen hydrolase family protein [Candidatus Latescibacterota bacterium]